MERDHWGDLGVDGRIILGWMFKNRTGDMGWIHLAQDRGRWRAVVYAVMNFRVPKIWGISCLAENLLATEEELCCMEVFGWLVICLVS